MFSQEVKDKAVSEFLQSGLTYRVFCDRYYSYMNHKTLERWVHNYKVKNHLAKEYASIKKVSKQESVSMVCYDVDKTNVFRQVIIHKNTIGFPTFHHGISSLLSY